jgi:hypothetical protein
MPARFDYGAVYAVYTKSLDTLVPLKFVVSRA